MGLNYQNFAKGIGLVPSSATSTTSLKGDLDVTTDGKLNYFNGSNSSSVITAAHSATLTNKTIGDTLLFAGSSSGTTGLVALASATGTLTLPSATDTLVGKATTDTLTNKTISGSSNTLTNIPNSALSNNSVTFNGATVALGGSATIKASTTNALTISTGLTGTSFDGSTAVTIAIDSTVVTLTGSQTLTNKALTSPALTTPTVDTINGITGSALTIQSAANQNVNIQAAGTGVVRIGNYSVSGSTFGTYIGTMSLTAPTGNNIELTAGLNAEVVLKSRTAFLQDPQATTGTAVTISSSKSYVSVSDPTLVSIAGVASYGPGDIFYITNDTGVPITILNDNASATATNRIYTGTGSDIILENTSSICLIYKYYGATSRWTVVGGVGGSITSLLTAGESMSAGTPVYISNGTGSDSGRTSGYIYKLNSANDDRVEFAGFTVNAVTSGSSVRIQVAGEIKNLTGLTVGKPIFADPVTPGGLTATVPSAANQWIIPVGIAKDASTLIINAAGSSTAVKITSSVVDGLYADVQSYSANTTLTNANSVVLVNASGGSRTITLPTPTRGKIFNIKKTDSSLNTVVISPPSGTIDGAATKSLAYQWDSLQITSDGTNFYLI